MNNHDLLDVYIFEYLSSLDCPRSLTAWLLWSNKEHEQLAKLDWQHDHYIGLIATRDSLAATKFLSKAVFLATDIDLRKEALLKFFEAESNCKATNRRITCQLYDNALTSSCLFRAERVISDILGDFLPDELIDSCNWGPGSTTMIKRSEANGPNKFDFENRISAKAYDFIAPWFNIAYPTWDKIFCIDGAAKIVTVPKNAKTDRVIAIEPGLNLWFQKGIGSLIRRRLDRAGIDLNDQSHNQDLARLGSKFNDLSTVDFSSASDTISYELVRQLLPVKWFKLLDSFRSSYGLLDGNPFHWEKFSSMGNGFTFELESLVFYALAVAVSQQLDQKHSTISVFGDDVILPSKIFDVYASVCADVGFTVNRQKSCNSGYYRESCGGYYWNGIDIKPIFQKEEFNGRNSLLKAANSIRRLAHRHNNLGCDIRFRATWQLLRDSLGPKTPEISEGYGDIGLVCNIDECQSPPDRAKHGIEGFTPRVWVVLAVGSYSESHGLLLYKLRSLGSSVEKELYFNPFPIDKIGIGNETPLPGRTRLARKRLLIHKWIDLGPWI